MLDFTSPITKNKMFKFENVSGQEIEVKIYIKDKDINFYTENKYNKNKYSSSYSYEIMKSKNLAFLLCKNINDLYDKIGFLIKENKPNFTCENDIINLIFETDMELDPELIIQLFNIKNNINPKNDSNVDSKINSKNNNSIFDSKLDSKNNSKIDSKIDRKVDLKID